MRFFKAAAILLAVLCLTRIAAAEPYHLRIGWVVAGADVATLMFAKPELAPHAGKSYIPELTHFEGTSTAMQALATGDLDCAALAYSTFALGVVNAGMKDLRVIGDGFQDGVPDYHTNAYMVRDDASIRTVEDLKGKVIATNQRGSAVDMAVRAMLAKHHLQDGRDVTMIEVRFPDQKAMLKEKKVDLITAVSPFGFDPELNRLARPLFHQVDAIGRSQMIVRVARDGFLKEHRDVMVDFIEDYLRVLRYLLDPAHHKEAVELLAQVTKREPSFYDAWAFTKQDYFRDPAALPDLDALQSNIDLQQSLGFLRAKVDVKKQADLDIAKEAAQRLGGEAGH
ncbi:MAG TPA: ABC transporter substrate-binding protein [Stellaceae bacterium]|jgi:NitT/TauT family transport system substrate-binding protein|nr:ABC transporter substrate-binding protein [Stellaceae bacterium]